MTVQELEDKVWTQDRICIVIRDSSNAIVGEYTQRNAAQANWHITKYLESRIIPLIGDREVIVLLGNGEQPHGRTLLSSARDSYKS